MQPGKIERQILGEHILEHTTADLGEERSGIDPGGSGRQSVERPIDAADLADHVEDRRQVGILGKRFNCRDGCRGAVSDRNIGRGKILHRPAEPAHQRAERGHVAKRAVERGHGVSQLLGDQLQTARLGHLGYRGP